MYRVFTAWRLQRGLIAKEGIGRIRAAIELRKEGVEPWNNVALATQSGEETAQVEGHHPVVLGSIALDPAVPARWIVWRFERAIQVTRLQVAVRWIEQVFPILCPAHELLVVCGIAERLSKSADGKVSAVVFKRRGCRTIEVTAAIAAVGRQIALVLKVIQARANVVGLRGLLHHSSQRGLRVKVRPTEGIEIRQNRVGGIAHHHVGLSVRERPLWQHTTLGIIVEHRLGNVAGLTWSEQGEQLRLRTVDIPAGEVGVLGMACCHGMNVSIKADILVIDIRENIRLEQRVVHRRIEGRELARGTAADLDLAQPVIPRLCGLGMNGVEVVIRIFPVDVGLCVGDADAKAPEPGPETETLGCCCAVFLVCTPEIPFFSFPCAISTWRTAGAIWLLPCTLVLPCVTMSLCQVPTVAKGWLN